MMASDIVSDCDGVVDGDSFHVIVIVMVLV